MKNTKRSLMSSVVALLLCFAMLLGTTYAWFTDTAMSVDNIIQSGELDIAMYWNDDLTGTWKNVEDENTIFDYDKWEPGYTEVRYVKIVNEGNLAFKYAMRILPLGEVSKLAEVIDVYYVEDPQSPINKETDLKNPVGTLAQAIAGGLDTNGTMTENGDELIVGIALKMRENAGNEYMGLSIGDSFSIQIVATQLSYEEDSFGKDYDKDATFPEVPVNEGVTAPVENDNGQAKNDVALNGENASATVPAGTKLEDGATSLTLTVTELNESNANITLGENEEKKSIDVHIDGVAATNDKPIVISLGAIAPVGQNEGNFKLYHVENAQSVEMTRVASVSELTAHNTFYYDPATGEVTVAMATFSEVALVADTVNEWEGKFDYSWYDANETELVIANADQLAAFGAIVGGMADGIEQDSFNGKTVKLVADINLGDKESENNPDIIFYPIGYYNNTGSYEKKAGNVGPDGSAVSSGFEIFEGTFDGNGHTIKNFYQNTWEMFGDYNDGYSGTPNHYRDGMGLFGKIYGGTVKNLTVSNFSSDGEYTTTSVIAAYADGATFENIAITNCNPRVYNIGNGGIVGCVGWYAKDKGLKTTFTNITVDNTNKISALWGSYDVACGGIVGQYYPTSGQSSAGNPKNAGIHLENCHVSAQMDVYNDVCGNYQYYAYRYAGMIIGSIRENTTNEDGKTIPDMNGISATGCTVNYGDWNDYYYCEFEKNGHPSYSGPTDYKFSRVPHSELNFTDSNGNGLVDADERASVTGCKHNHTDAENNKAIYLPFHQLFTGYGWGVNSIGLEKYSGIVTNLDITEGEQEESVEKFEIIKSKLTNNRVYKFSDIFAYFEKCGVALVPGSLTVGITNLDENGNVSSNIVYDRKTWENSTIEFENTGKIKLTIQDYYFCTPTELIVEITERQPEVKFDVVLNNGDFLHRVGNSGTVALDTLFKAKDGVTVGTMSVTVEAVNGTSASGTYSNNAIKFSGTGVVKVTITDYDYCTPTVLTLEVVDAKNVTTAESATANNVVLLNNIGSGFTVSGEYTFFGNGFTLNYTGDGRYLNNGLKQGLVTVSENGTIDNLHIKASIYPTAFMYYGQTSLGDYVQQGDNPREVDGENTRYYYQLSAVVAKGNATIQNCYIYGGRTNVFVDTGNVTIKDSILECGTVANAQIQSTAEYTVTLENVTTIQYQVNATVVDTSKVMLGAGVLVGPDTTSNPTIVLNGDFKQYNWVTEDDKNAVSAQTAKMLIGGALDATNYNHTVNGKTASNLGIVYMNTESIEVTNNTGLPYFEGQVTMEVGSATANGTVYSLQNATESQIYSDYANADRTTVNGDYMPTFEFDLGDQEITYDGSEDTRYLYGDTNGVIALYKDGEDPLALDLTKLATIYKYKGIPYDVTVVCKNSSGNALEPSNGVVTLDAQGSYTIEFTVTDNIFYDKNGQTIDKKVERTFEVPLELTVKAASIKNAVVNITKTALDGVYNTVNLTDYELRINFLDCISITDYDDKGDDTTVNLSSNISSATLTPSGVNVFTTASTITITYTDGRVLTVNLSNISGSSPGTKTAKVNTSGSVYFTTEGALNNKPTEASSQNKCTITSVSYKGNSGSTVTNDTDVTVTWALGSSGGSSPCVTSDTLVTLADGTQKEIQDVTYEDKLLVWDFYNGEYAAVPAAIIFDHGYGDNTVIKLNFSNGANVKVVNMHQFFDATLNKMVTIDANSVQQYVGHEFICQDGDGYSTVTLDAYTTTNEYVEAWGIMSALHYNIIVEGIFSADFDPADLGLFNYFEIGENMKYDTEKMQADIEKYGLYTYDDFAEYLTYEQFVAFNVQYFKIPVCKGYYTYSGILDLIDTYLKG